MEHANEKKKVVNNETNRNTIIQHEIANVLACFFLLLKMKAMYLNSLFYAHCHAIALLNFTAGHIYSYILITSLTD